MKAQTSHLVAGSMLISALALLMGCGGSGSETVKALCADGSIITGGNCATICASHGGVQRIINGCGFHEDDDDDFPF